MNLLKILFYLRENEMKKILFLSVCFFCSGAGALDHNCIPHIEQLERDFQNCTVAYGDDATTADMNNASYNAADCAVEIAHKLMDTYYASTAETTKKEFDALVRQIYSYSHNLIQESDYAREHHIGSIHNSMAINKAEELIKALTKSYIDELKEECQNATDYKPENKN